ncbi:Gfo/Idh/MocA family protein [Streptomyces sp. wa1063]|uniref:Gfo/Idh/MocA family protein n=1 Tax=Streptomyces sp. wa1063 TaxID=1828212 RepID=UPI00211D98D9|nr:Gfo/Idh/MocA family oxidoreductase [Streptomyces sp. wa1063]
MSTAAPPADARPDPVRIAVLGCADIARRRMLPAFAASPDVEITAVAGRSAERAKELAERFGCRAMTGYETALADDEVRAVYVPLPAALHATWVERALLAGKHVLAEKPLSLSLPESRTLTRLAAERGLALMENVMFVHHAQHDAVRGLLSDGAIGELRALQAAFTVPRLDADDIRYRPELGGGALTDTGVYPVRAALHLLGPDLEVAGAHLARGAGFAVDTAGAALLRDERGVGAQLTFGLDHAYRNTYELWGSTGRITVDRAFTPPADHRPVIRLENRDGVREVALAPDDQVANTVAAFVTAVRTQAPPDDTILHQARLLDEIRGHANPREGTER